MAKPPGNNIARCEECGKLFEALSDEVRCTYCRSADVEDEDVLHNAVERLALELNQHAALETEADLLIPPPPPKCVRCARYPRLDDSEFCLTCQIELVNDLGHAAYELFEHVRQMPAKARYVSLRNVLEEKRNRTATSHLRLAPTQRVK